MDEFGLLSFVVIIDCGHYGMVSMLTEIYAKV